jgi:hypothetical protein
VDEVVCRLGIPADMTRVVLVNGKDAEPGHRLGPGDSVAIFPPLMGGSAAAARGERYMVRGVRGERRRGG